MTSDIDPRYNCIAYAAGETHRRWWPIFHPDYYWPPGAPKINSIASFVAAFQTLGYVECVDGTFEKGFEKVAFYALNGVPTHAARQIGSGKWVSKLGDGFDIQHLPDAVSSGIYGQIEKYMKRPIPAPSKGNK
ncbi:hypothetical protein [Bradyrhizobium sp. CB2312]|uniref:DUF7689 domain-containing protein n=1 Tax=Bradyrhizobium sp. CB2312 TaxID=3039155 RepID=UPI0024B1091C|nr:hypothetical protein [Bradyrhizobium sp. CB2312]WFU68582.1 hypothetical protein QA642_24970 [Bradyrhizobium sp. CB2312]